MVYVEILFVFVLMVVNGLLAMSELAIVSSRPGRLRTLAGRNVSGSRRALALNADPGRFLSTVQIGITLVGVLSGAFSGATLGLRMADWLESIGVADGFAEVIGVGMVVAAITYISLIVGELVPKQIALRNPEAVAVRVAPAMMALAKFGTPLVWLLDESGQIILRALGHHEPRPQQVSDEEIKLMIAEAESAGVLEPREREMITGVMRLADRSVRGLMTPRVEVDMIDLADPAAVIRAAIMKSVHSNLPVYEENPDNVLGIVQVKALLDQCMAGRTLDVRGSIRKTAVIPDNASALSVLATLKELPVHIAMVHDEYGHFEGVVTTADILEAIVGELKTQEASEPASVQRDDGSFLIAGWMPVDELGELLGVVLPASRNFHTVAGFVLEGFGRLPAIGESFIAHGWRFEVIDLDGRRIDKVLVRRVAPTRRAGVQ